MKILKILRCLYRGHQYRFRNNLHGDRAMVMGARSIWACAQCGAVEHRKELHEEPEVPEPSFVAEKVALPDAFPRSTSMRCPTCCARRGEPHTPECTESGLA